MDPQAKIKRQLELPEFWEEASKCADLYTIKYCPWGLATVSIPDFFRECIARAGQEMNVLQMQYQRTHGTEGLKKAIVTSFAEYSHFPNLDSEKNIAVGSGAMCVIEFLIRMNIRVPDEEVLVFEPFYPYHFIGMRDKGKLEVARSFFNEEKRRFEFDYEDFKSKLSPKTRLVIVCNPNNPTARIFDREEYEKLGKILEEFPQVRVIEDCAYSVYLNCEKPVTYFHEIPGHSAKTYTVFSAGKIFNTTGNRVGWVMADEALITEFRNYSEAFYFISAVENYIYELAFLESMKPYKGFGNFWKFHADDNVKRLHYMTAGLDKLGIDYLPSEGSYYLLMDAVKLSQKIGPKFFKTWDGKDEPDPARDAAVCRKLLNEHQVGVYPLSKIMVYETNNDRFIRIAFNRSYEDIDFFLGELKQILDGK